MMRWLLVAAVGVAVACGRTETGDSAPVIESQTVETGDSQAPQAPTSPAPESTSVGPLTALTEEARPDPPPPPRLREVTASVGTELRLELTTGLSSETAQVETPIRARLREPVVVDGLTVIPAGAVFHGEVIDVERAGRVRGRSHLSFRFTEVAVDGQREPIRTRELTFEGEATVRDDATKVGTGAGIGAVIGGIVGGGGGAAKGAAIGGAAGAGAVLATRGREVDVAAGSVVTTALASPYGIQVEVR